MYELVYNSAYRLTPIIFYLISRLNRVYFLRCPYSFYTAQAKLYKVNYTGDRYFYNLFFLFSTRIILGKIKLSI